jgi:hypothetical protein
MPSRAVLLVIALALVAWTFPRPVSAQVSRPDSAAILLNAAQRLEADGQRVAASAVLTFIVRNYGDTPSGAEARRALTERPAAAEEGSGRVELVAWGTLYGAWLGIVVPAALSVDQPELWGVGLLGGGPLGFAAAQSIATSRHVTLGEARAMTFGFRWGTSQALGWLLELSDDVSTETAFATMGLGGLGGMALGGAIAHRGSLTAGQVAYSAQGYYWGTYYAASLAAIANIDDHTGSWIMAGGDIGMLAAAAMAPEGITAGRAWLTSAMGIAGMVAGFGVDLIIGADNEELILGIPMATSAVGLILGARSARAMAQRGADNGGGAGQGARPAALPSALLDIGAGGFRVGAPAPVPIMQRVGERGPRPILRPALTVPLLHVAF